MGFMESFNKRYVVEKVVIYKIYTHSIVYWIIVYLVCSNKSFTNGIFLILKMELNILKKDPDNSEGLLLVLDKPGKTIKLEICLILLYCITEDILNEPSNYDLILQWIFNGSYLGDFVSVEANACVINSLSLIIIYVGHDSIIRKRLYDKRRIVDKELSNILQNRRLLFNRFFSYCN